MADLHNQQPVIGVRLLSEGATLYNNRPVIGVRAATGLVFTDNQIVRGVEVIDDDRPLYNGQPVVGAVMIDDDRDLYNLQLVVPVEGLTPPFDPSILFSNGERGAWYDPSDLSTLFQDAAGTVPVMADGQPVGLMLDKHSWGGKMLAQVIAGQVERITNGTFDTDINGWAAMGTSGSASWQSGKLRVTRITTLPYPVVGQTISGLVVGRSYQLSADYVNPSGRFVRVGVSGVQQSGGPTNTSGTFTPIFTAKATSHSMQLGFEGYSGGVGEYIDFDNASWKEIPGNHASQATTAARPTYRDIGGVRYLESDGVDDALNVSFPAGSYTRAYVTAAGGMTIDEGVAISGPENIMQAPTIAGILYIDRALTSDEKSKLAAYWGATL